jgi:sn-glycerol 3-phosphate transport system permease protein
LSVSTAKSGEAPIDDRPSPSVTVRPTRFGPRERRDFLVFLAFAGPNILLIIMFSYRPVIQNIQYSLLNWTLGSTSATAVGLGNYVEFLTSPGTLDILRVTVVFTLVTVGGSMVLGLLIALALNRRIRGIGLARATVFAPYVLSGVGVGFVWQLIFDPAIGILGVILRSVGLSNPEWFRNPNLTLVMVMIVYIWKNMGYAAVIYLAGLQAVPKDLLEAAALDGASSSRTFRSVVWPLLSPTTFFLVITSILSSLQAFDIIQAMTPLGNGTTTLIYESYLQGFINTRAGYSATIATILFVLLVIFTIVQLRFVERRVHYS